MTFILKKEDFFMPEQLEYKSVLAPFIKNLLALKAAAGYTSLHPKYILLEFDRFFYEQKISQPIITRQLVQEWQKSRLNDRPRTLYEKYGIIKQLSSLLSRSGYESFEPRFPLSPSRLSVFTPYIFTHEQIEQLLNASSELRLSGKYMRSVLFCVPSVIRLLYSTGLRISEALSITNKDVKWDLKYIHIRKTKNQSERIVPIHDSLHPVLLQYKSYRSKIPIQDINSPDVLFFIKPDGTAVYASAFYIHFRKLLKLCNIPYKGDRQGPRVHDLRHTFAVHALEQMLHNGMDLYNSMPVLSTFLGHKSIAATELYVRLTAEIYPELVKQSSVVSSNVYPSIKTYDL
jgi:integrase